MAFAMVRSYVADLSRTAKELPAADVPKVDEVRAELSVCHSEAGYYLGKTENGKPVGRYSTEYWENEAAAETALRTGRFNYRDANERGQGYGL